MHPYVFVLGLTLPSYGLAIVTGLLFANGIAYAQSRNKQYHFEDILILEAYGLLGGFLGAKLLYIIVVFRWIDWGRLLEPVYLQSLMQGGFVFYGGAAGGLGAALMAGRIHALQARRCIRDLFFLLPFVHAFGRLGCFMAGCCYGIPYHGVGAVVFPEGSYAPYGIELFPVQLMEAVLLMLLSVVLYFHTKQSDGENVIEIYMLFYGILRFGLEYLRYDDRGKLWFLSTSQAISIVLIALSVFILVMKRRRKGRIIHRFET